MRYHFQKPFIFLSKYGETYECTSLIYTKCTLYRFGDIGLAVIQQRYDPKTKATYWSEIDPWLTDVIYTNENFSSYVEKYASKPDGDIYPTVTVRQIMWALGMKPIKKEPWETYFDRKLI